MQPLAFLLVLVVVLLLDYFDDDEEERQRRTEAYPTLNWPDKLRLNGYGGFDWRDSGSAAYRRVSIGVGIPSPMPRTCPSRPCRPASG